jgi:twitching motility protein PilI
VNNEVYPHPLLLLQEIDKRNQQRVQAKTPGESQPASRRGRLAVRVGAWRLLFSMDDVKEIIPVPRVTQVPGVKDWLLGIANLRGAVVSVIDLYRFFCEEPTRLGSNSRLIVVVSGEWSYGLLADEVIGMRHFNSVNKLSTLDAVHAQLRLYLTEGFEMEQQQWLSFNVDQFLNEPKFLNAAS